MRKIFHYDLKIPQVLLLTTMALKNFRVHYSGTHKSLILDFSEEDEKSWNWDLLNSHSSEREKNFLSSFIFFAFFLLLFRYPTSSSSRTNSYFQSRQVSMMNEVWHCKYNYNVHGSDLVWKMRTVIDADSWFSEVLKSHREWKNLFLNVFKFFVLRDETGGETLVV